MPAERGADQRRAKRLEGEQGLGEIVWQAVASHPAEVAARRFGRLVVAEFRRQGGEIGFARLEFRQRLAEFRFRGIRIALQGREENLAGVEPLRLAEGRRALGEPPAGFLLADLHHRREPALQPGVLGEPGRQLLAQAVGRERVAG